jgi:hypothetical protein
VYDKTDVDESQRVATLRVAPMYAAGDRSWPPMPTPDIVMTVAPVVGPLIGCTDVMTARSSAKTAVEELGWESTISAVEATLSDMALVVLHSTAEEEIHDAEHCRPPTSSWRSDPA